MGHEIDPRPHARARRDRLRLLNTFAIALLTLPGGRFLPPRYRWRAMARDPIQSDRIMPVSMRFSE
ncbi:MAG: hypothetical protein M3Z96_00010 [Pseudomonadota bacterium]|nr:hypothetical protein [Pseudomonadota bacterium]